MRKGRVVHSYEEFLDTYLPNHHMRYKEELKLGHINVCPKCGCKVVVWNKHETFGYFLCYACGWSSMTPAEIGRAMAKESCKKLKLDLSKVHGGNK